MKGTIFELTCPLILKVSILNHMIEANNLSLEIRGKIILKNINFRLNNKALILGPNGSGKTTLLKTLSGFYRYKGSVKIDGNELKDINYISLSTNIPDAYYIAMKVKDILSILSEIKGCKKDLFESMMKEVNINPLDKNPFSLSMGEKTIVFTALALSSEPKIVMIDEPFENLDKNRKNIMMKWLNKYGKEGFIVTHDLEMLKNFQEWNMYLMIEGKLYGPITVKEFLSSKLVEGNKEGSILKIEIGERKYSLVSSKDNSSILDINNIYDYV
ncbi:ATP-binding cassette domain-containing protein [Acidianus brierleyi]|uniref:ABC transporter domain-containing protein n=2 Tax=Acidianus brierleyi TaxID=41673 RepID=A0A2U9IHS0_9CREN|nr:ATP-binding cassette domain-containing protein [Acidianus brierleyi]